MTKQEKEVVSLKYSGKIDGLTLEKFDDLVVRATSTQKPFGKMNS
jgi:hypothetical protein